MRDGFNVKFILTLEDMSDGTLGISMEFDPPVPDGQLTTNAGKIAERVAGLLQFIYNESDGEVVDEETEYAEGAT